MPAKWQQWMPLKIDAWRGSPAVRAMHPSARSGYLDLILYQWQTDDCTVPSDPIDLADISGLGDELWAIYGPRILRNFDQAADGRLRNQVCFEEWEKAKTQYEKNHKPAEEVSEQRSKAGKAGNAKRWAEHEPKSHKNADESQTDRICDIENRKKSLTDTVTRTLDISEDANASSSPRRDADGAREPDPEELIYQEYPRKEGHGSALKAIAKAVARVRKGEGSLPAIPEVRDARIYLYRRVQTYARSPAGQRPDRLMIPHPATWFNQSRYLDDESNWHVSSPPDGGSINGRPGTHIQSANSERVQRNLAALAKAIERRGVGTFGVAGGTDGGEVPTPAPRGIAGGVLVGLRTNRAEVLPPQSPRRANGSSH